MKAYLIPTILVSAMVFFSCSDDVPDDIKTNLNKNLQQKVAEDLRQQDPSLRLSQLGFKKVHSCYCDAPTENRQCFITVTCEDVITCTAVLLSQGSAALQGSIRVLPSQLSMDIQLQYTTGEIVDETTNDNILETPLEDMPETENNLQTDTDSDQFGIYQAPECDENNECKQGGWITKDENNNPVWHTVQIDKHSSENPQYQKNFRGYEFDYAQLTLNVFMSIPYNIPGEINQDFFNSDEDPTHKIRFRIRPRFYVNGSSEPIIGKTLTQTEPVYCEAGLDSSSSTNPTDAPPTEQ